MTLARITAALNEHHADLSGALTATDCHLCHLSRSRWHHAWHRLTAEATPGYPTRTPASGEPGGGTGTITSITERLAETLAYDAELADLRTLEDGPASVTLHLRAVIHRRGIGPHIGEGGGDPVNQLRVARALLRWMLDSPVAMSHIRAVDVHQLNPPIRHLVGTVNRWAYTPGPSPNTRATTNQRATDLTDMWCTSCLRIGQRCTRHRGPSCRWCYDYNRVQGFDPPLDVLEAHHDGRPIEVARLTEAHRRRVKAKR